VPHNFTNSISDIKCKQMGPGQVYMAVSSWDGTVQAYQVMAEQGGMGGMGTSSPPNVNPAGQPVATQGPVLGLCWMADAPGQQPNVVLYIAHSDCSIKRWDPQQGMPPQNVGQHEGPVKDVYSFTLNNNFFLVSGGWDCNVKFWQIQGPQLQQIGQSWVAKPVHVLSGAFPILVTAHSEKFVHVWDL
jgi:WD40 repeat protein